MGVGRSMGRRAHPSTPLARKILDEPDITRVIDVNADANAVKCLTRQVNAMPARRGLVNHALLDVVYSPPGSWIWSCVSNALATTRAGWAPVMNTFVRNALARGASIWAGMAESTVDHIPGMQASAAF